MDWVNIDSDITEKDLIVYKRGRLGLAFTMAACNILLLIVTVVFLQIGSHIIINRPSKDEEAEIIDKIKEGRAKDR